MSDETPLPRSQKGHPEYPQARLERFYIEEYLKSKGSSLKKVAKLPRAAARALMVDACMYASTKLTELETRSRLVNELHGNF